MTYVIQAVLSDPRRPACGQCTIPFPIPDDAYDDMIEMLGGIGIGDAVAKDCRIDAVDSFYGVLGSLTGTMVNVDELDYLAKRLDSFCDNEAEQFQAMAHKLELKDIKDFINLTFCCQQATVITDFTDLERIGKDHALTVCGDSMPMEMIERVGGRTVALDLIQRGAGTITPYGVVYDNGMKLEPLYDGRHFPVYVYQPSQLTVEIKSRPEAEITGHLYLPCPDRQVQRTLERAGSGGQGFHMEVTMDSLPQQVSSVISLTRDGLDELNALCRAIAPLNAEQREKLDAVVLLARPECASEVCQLAENLDQFDFVPKSDRPEADSALTELGYVAYHGSLTLEELMRDDPAEQYQQEQEMGGMA